MTEGAYIIRIGEVVSLYDEQGGGRVRIQLTGEDYKKITDVPYAFPLLPKTIQSTPKIGEAAFVLCSQSGNIMSNRYYLGPVISQRQDMHNCPYNKGYGQAVSLTQSAKVGPYPTPLSQFPKTEGAYPDISDVALVGRRSEDIILKDNEIDLRCGIREEPLDDENPSLKGFVQFNSDNHPTYIQLKHKKGLTGGDDNGVVNVVADKINLISHKQDTSLAGLLTHAKSAQGATTNPLIQDADLQDIMGKLHQVPYGDVLVEVLTSMCQAIFNHQHRWAQLPPTDDDSILQLKDKFNDIPTMLSPNVRIS